MEENLNQVRKDAPKYAHSGCRPTYLNRFARMPLYFPYLLFGRGSKKRLGGVSLAWLSLRDCEEKEGEEGRPGWSKVFFLCAFSCMVIGPAAPALPQ